MKEIMKLLLIPLACFALCTAIENTRYYPRYHLAPVKGWMNDPNGFSVFDGMYHLFHQHNPEGSFEPGIVRWGHAKSKDLLHWVDVGIALDNDTKYDKDGVFSGSAVVDSNVMYLFFTGNVKTPEPMQVQELAVSYDGVHFKKYENPIVKGESLQPNIRDPKVWKHNNNWYMVLGNSFQDQNNQTLGRIFLYKSTNKLDWKQVSVLGESEGYLGYMWECPDLFELNGRFILLFSPQGLKQQDDKFKNLYQTGYIIGHFNYQDYLFSPITDFKELDSGHDFYATQTILDNKGRRLLVAWMDMWDTKYPESEDGFKGQMILPRSLYLTQDNRLLQKPIDEVTLARGKTLFRGMACKGTVVALPNKAGEVIITAPRTQDFTLYIGNDTSSVKINYEFIKGRVSLTRDGEDGLRRTKYRPLHKLYLRVFIDASSVEVFVGEGEVTFSSRFFVDDVITVRLDDNCIADVLEVYEIKTTLYTT